MYNTQSDTFVVIEKECACATLKKKKRRNSEQLGDYEDRFRCEQESIRFSWCASSWRETVMVGETARENKKTSITTDVYLQYCLKLPYCRQKCKYQTLSRSKWLQLQQRLWQLLQKKKKKKSVKTGRRKHYKRKTKIPIKWSREGDKKKNKTKNKRKIDKKQLQQQQQHSSSSSRADFLIPSHHPSLSNIALLRSSKWYQVSAKIKLMWVFAGLTTPVCPCERIRNSIKVRLGGVLHRAQSTDLSKTCPLLFTCMKGDSITTSVLKWIYCVHILTAIFLINRHHPCRWVSVFSWLNYLILAVDPWSATAKHPMKHVVNPFLDSLALLRIHYAAFNGF